MYVLGSYSVLKKDFVNFSYSELVQMPPEKL